MTDATFNKLYGVGLVKKQGSTLHLVSDPVATSDWLVSGEDGLLASEDGYLKLDTDLVTTIAKKLGCPAGSVIPFYNVTLGGDESRNPIFWGESEADTGWLLCDGGSDGLGGYVPDLTDKFIKGATVADASTTGGSATVTLTTSNMPSHTHSVTVASAGSHTHTRGTMNITGGFDGNVDDDSGDRKTGAFYHTGTQAWGANGNASEYGGIIGFDASRSWTGSTSSSGSHTHTGTCAATGSGSAFSIEPPYFTMAYFVKLPS